MDDRRIVLTLTRHISKPDNTQQIRLLGVAFHWSLLATLICFIKRNVKALIILINIFLINRLEVHHEAATA